MNVTLPGLWAILIWGASLSFARTFEGQIGPIAYMGVLYLFTGLIALQNVHRLKKFPDINVFRNPVFYLRGLFFVLHEVLLTFGIIMVTKEHVPFVILLNYLWPTATIICTVLIADVKITRLWAFILGTVIIIASMGHEILGPDGISSALFLYPKDCLAYVITFIGAISWGLYCAVSRRCFDTTGGSGATPVFQLALCAFFLPLSFMPGMATWASLMDWGILILIAYAFVQFLAYLGWDFSMHRGNVVILSLCADFIPWLSLIAAYFILDVEIASKTIISAVILVIGAMITRYGTLQKRA